MAKTFIYGKSVEGENFTDRVKESARLKTNFEEGLNTIIISPRRLGKTSLVRKVQKSINRPDIKVVFMDIYDCRSEYDFLNRFASVLMKELAGKSERILETIKEFLVRLTPKFAFTPEANSEFSFSLGITPHNYQPEEILQLPQIIAEKRNVQIVICIDEFQQIGEFPDSLSVQKRMRGVWQHQRNVAYCMFGSKRHMMENLFRNKSMPFYQFGEITHLNKIPMEDWVPFIIERFATKGKIISQEWAQKICATVECYSSYVQQLAWDVLLETDECVTEESFNSGLEALLEQNCGLFIHQIDTLTSFQLNFLRAVCNGVNMGFSSQKVINDYNLGTKSNVVRLKNSLIDKELIEISNRKVYIADPVFKLWFRQHNMG